MNLMDLAEHFSNEDAARTFLEKLLWPSGPECPHCGLIGEAYKLTPKPRSKNPVRKGVWKCSGCREKFTVTIGTIFEDSHIPLQKWLLAFHIICASKKGISSHQVHRMLGVTYKSAWFMTHRIRHAMGQLPGGKLSGPENTVEIDETFIGGKERASLECRTPIVAKRLRLWRLSSVRVVSALSQSSV